MKNRLPTILLTISILINLTIGVIWFYNSQQSNYDNCLLEKKQLTAQVDSLNNKLHKSWKEQKYFLEVMLNSGLDFQKLMPEYSDLSKEKFTESIRQKVVELKIKLGEK
jgi:peptidoglycan hydrolase CwlO-like protein